MPLNTLQSRQVSGVLIISVTPPGSAALAAPGADFFRFLVPDRPGSQGIVIRSASARAGGETGTATANIDIQNQTTTMLSADIILTGTASQSATLADDGQEIVASGRFISVDGDAGAGVWSASTALTDVFLQINYDWQ